MSLLFDTCFPDGVPMQFSPGTQHPANGAADRAPRLYVFPHAGGSSLMYHPWEAHFPAHWRLLPQDAPGHGLRIGEELICDADTLIEHFLDRLAPQLAAEKGPFGFFGHSMGALVAHELTRRLIARGDTPPTWLGLSGCSAPQQPATTAPEAADGHRRTLHDGLDDAELRRRLGQLGGTPARVLSQPELWSFFAPVIRADLRLLRTWRHHGDGAPLPVPLSVFGGRSDAAAMPEKLAPWSGASTRFLGLRLFDGGHFYFQDDPAGLAAAVTADFARASECAQVPAGAAG